MTPQKGSPAVEGRYVVFCPCESAQVAGWLEPIIATWHGGKWHMPARPVSSWIGPLPVLRADDRGETTWDEVFSDLRKSEHGSFVADKPTQEYDL